MIGIIIGAAVAFVVIGLILYIVGVYNGLVRLKNDIKSHGLTLMCF